MRNTVRLCNQSATSLRAGLSRCRMSWPLSPVWVTVVEVSTSGPRDDLAPGGPAQEVVAPMQGGNYPGGALPAPISRTPVVAALVALVVGAAAATGIWWLTDNDVSILPEPATKVIVAQPGEPGAGAAAKNEAGVAAAVSGSSVAVDPSTGGAEAEASSKLSDEKLSAAYGTETGQRYDGGPEEGSAGRAFAGAGQGP
jgi:hypothetical protein